VKILTPPLDLACSSSYKRRIISTTKGSFSLDRRRIRRISISGISDHYFGVYDPHLPIRYICFVVLQLLSVTDY